MSLKELNRFQKNPEIIAHSFSQYVRALVLILMWAIIGIASLVAACVAVGAIWIAVRFILNLIGF